MTKPKKFLRLLIYADLISEIGGICDEISESYTQSRRLSAQKTNLESKLGWLDNCNKITTIYASLHDESCTRDKLYKQADQMIKDVTDFVWTSDNPNIKELRSELILVARMVMDDGKVHYTC